MDLGELKVQAQQDCTIAGDAMQVGVGIARNETNDVVVTPSTLTMVQQQQEEQQQGAILHDLGAAVLRAAAAAADEVVVHHQSAMKTELEKEMELFEASEAQDQTRLAYNEKKRPLDPTPASAESRKKRGRKPSAATKRKDEGKDEDDVCSICYDGGDLMLCDNRTCPKAYHLQCIGRDEKFPKSKGKWLCAWHFCSICSKKCAFRCYTCPKAYCAACKNITPSFYQCEKGKGLCEDCLTIIRMIQDAESSQVDFSDRDSHEGLFKMYWEESKEKHNIKVPTFDKEGKVITEPNTGSDDGSEEASSESESQAEVAEVDEADDGKRELKTRGMSALIDNPKCAINQEQQVEEEDEFDLAEEEGGGGDEDEAAEDEPIAFKPAPFDGWASKELMNFLKNMNEDPRKPLTRPTINKLLWEYIKSKNLQKPGKKSVIRCDEQLRALFGRKTVQHQSILKLMQMHLAPKPTGNVKKGLLVDVKESDVEDDRGKKRGKSKDEFAAITPANVNLVYLRRALLEDLLDDPQFHQKVVGTYVRIRVPGMVSKNEMCYRLVQVVGTRTQDEEYKAGKKTTKLVLQIVNLGKKEDVTVDLVSNQDFTPDECKRLRQSIRCGFIPAPTVGDFEQKNLAIREAKLNDWFETETSRLTALRDRANEKGRKRELRECVEKLQKLSEPSYRAKELAKVPTFEVDSRMDPTVESDEEPPEAKPMSSPGEARARWGSSIFEEKRRPEPPVFAKQDSFKREEPDWRMKEALPLPPLPPLGPPLGTPLGRPPPMVHPAAFAGPMDVHERVWCYLDPSGMQQGPFTMEQLRNWNKSGHFPTTLRVWRERQPRETGVLLVEVLAALEAPSPPSGLPPPPQHGGYGLASPAADPTRGYEWRPNGNTHRSPSVEQGWQQQGQHPSPSPRQFSEGGGGGYQENNGWRSGPQQQQGWSSGGGGWNENRGMRPGGWNPGGRRATPCKFYAKGYCRNGDACPFHHG